MRPATGWAPTTAAAAPLARAPAIATRSVPALRTQTRVPGPSRPASGYGMSTSPSGQPAASRPRRGGPSSPSMVSSSGGPGRPNVPTRRRSAPDPAGTSSLRWHARSPPCTVATNATGGERLARTTCRLSGAITSVTAQISSTAPTAADSAARRTGLAAPPQAEDREQEGGEEDLDADDHQGRREDRQALLRQLAEPAVHPLDDDHDADDHAG